MQKCIKNSAYRKNLPTTGNFWNISPMCSRRNITTKNTIISTQRYAVSSTAVPNGCHSMATNSTAARPV